MFNEREGESPARKTVPIVLKRQTLFSRFENISLGHARAAAAGNYGTARVAFYPRLEERSQHDT
jgi:hypothetical protein